MAKNSTKPNPPSMPKGDGTRAIVKGSQIPKGQNPPPPPPKKVN